MKKTAPVLICGSGRIVTCENVGHTLNGKAIWKNIRDAYECFTYQMHAFWPYDPDEYDDLGELYGTYIDESGERVEA